MKKLLVILLFLLSFECFAALPTANSSNTGYLAYGTSCSAVSGTPQVPATYDDAGVGAALTAAAAAADKIVKFSSNYTPASRITIPDNVTIFSENGALITSSGTTSGFLLGNNSRITGFRFTGARPIALISATAITTPSTINCNSFTDITSQAIYDQSTADNTIHTGLTVQWNNFQKNAYAMWFTRIANFIISDNYLVGSTNRNIEYHGARNSQFLRNYISGGVTGIAGLADSQYNRIQATFIDNVIADNYLSGITEEAISYDANGDSGANSTFIDQFDVTSTSGSWNSSPRVLVGCTSCSGLLSAGVSGYALTWITGANAGKSWVAVATANTAPASAGTTIYIQLRTTSLSSEDNINATEFAAISAGDKVVIGHQAINNKILRNWIDNSRTGILLWGMGYKNTIAGNIVTRMTSGGSEFVSHAIGIRSLCGVVNSTKYVNPNTVTTILCGPSDYNEVFNNTTDDEIAVGGKSYQTLGNTVGVNVVESNQLYNNIGSIISEAYWNSTNDGYYGNVLNNASLISDNTALVSAGLEGFTSLTSTTLAKPKGNSTVRRAGKELNKGNIQDFGNRAFHHPPTRGAWEFSDGDAAASRTTASTRTARQ